MDATSLQVKAQYESFPYPGYPILAKPRTEELLSCSSAYNRILAGQSGVAHNTLILGCGEFQPLAFRKVEPHYNRLNFVDLSARSIRRGRLRLGLNKGNAHFYEQDIESFLLEKISNCDRFDHIDLYGVLHHMPNPGSVIKLLPRVLQRDGVIRCMVYNSSGRRWIHGIQKMLKTLDLSPWSKSERRRAIRFVKSLTEYSNVYDYFFENCSPRLLTNENAFVDTFMHRCELQDDISFWLSSFDRCGLECVALLDRYSELDDLTNPLWSMPRTDQLMERVRDRRFEGNLELILVPKAIEAKRVCESSSYDLKLYAQPPSWWFLFDETNSLPRKWKRHFWMHWHEWVQTGALFPEDFLKQTPFRAIQRLARIGGILRGQLREKDIAVIGAAIDIEGSFPEPLDKSSHLNNLFKGVEQLLGRGLSSQQQLDLYKTMEWVEEFYM